jgi:hypothetical protein
MVAQLPSIVVAAFQSPGDLREGWGVVLYQLWNGKTPEVPLADRARALVRRLPRLSAREVYETLISASGCTRQAHGLNKNLPIRGASGVILFREQDQIGNITFTVPKTLLSPKRRAALKQAMVRILESTNA